MMVPVYIVPNSISFKHDERSEMNQHGNPVEMAFAPKPVKDNEYSGNVNRALHIFPVFSFQQLYRQIVAGDCKWYEDEKCDPSKKHHRLRQIRKNSTYRRVLNKIPGKVNR